MKVLIISSSQRAASQSAKVAEFMLHMPSSFTKLDHIELCKYDLPFWDGEQESRAAHKNWRRISNKVSQADALVLITPEWGGMASPLIKNFLLMCNNQQTAHKPALLVAISSGISGAYPIAELRMNALKNNKLVAVPDHLIIRNVEEVLNQPNSSTLTERDSNLQARIKYSLQMLYQYSQALLAIRQQHNNAPYPKQQEYIYGM